MFCRFCIRRAKDLQLVAKKPSSQLLFPNGPVESPCPETVRQVPQPNQQPKSHHCLHLAYQKMPALRPAVRRTRSQCQRSPNPVFRLDKLTAQNAEGQTTPPRNAGVAQSVGRVATRPKIASGAQSATDSTGKLRNARR